MPTDFLQMQAAAVLQQYPCRGDVRSLVRRTGGFSGAAVFEVRTSDAVWCLRRWPAGALPPARIAGLHRLLRHIHEAGVTQVAVPVAALNRTTLPSSGDYLWQLEPWMPGTADFHDRPGDARLRSTMHCLAAWHRAAACFDPPGAEREWFGRSDQAASPAVTERLRLINDWRGGRLARLKGAILRRPEDRLAEVGHAIVSLFERATPNIAGELEAAARLRFRLQPCLRDVWHDHVLLIGDDVTGLIDPSACRMENVATDLARLIGSLAGDEARQWQLALEAYSRKNSLTPEELRLVAVLDRSAVLLSGLIWLDRRFLGGQTWPEVDRVERRLRAILERLQHLASR
jgi:Ser/Thr protein kinase RdoA (MazF antagonist)